MALKYEYSADAANENSAAAKVAGFVPSAARVLEIGSGPGAITRVLRERNGCTITAIEIDEEAARIVAPYCEQVFKCDLNDPNWTKAVSSQGRFDVVVAADVLEHLYDPAAVLKAMQDALKPGGCVVISLPHAGHNAVIAALLNGDFEYRNIGLLDSTHIRFFGLKNIQALFKSAGFAIVAASFVGRHASNTELRNQWQALKPRTRRMLESSNPHGCIYQVVLKAVLQAETVATVNLLDLPFPDLSPTWKSRVAESLHRALRPFMSPSVRQGLKRLAALVGVRP